MSFSKGIIDSLSIDCLIFGWRNENLEVLLVKHGEGISKGKWALPGGWIRFNESIDEATNRLLSDLTGISNLYLEQFRTYGDVGRYPTKRVITIAYLALVKPENFNIRPGFTASDAQWFDLHKIPDLPYDHNRILSEGLKHLKFKVKHEPIGFNLLPKKFTLSQIQLLYESMMKQKFDKPNFRRKLLSMQLLVPCKKKEKAASHRAATLYRFDVKNYKKLKEKGFLFEL